jgi:hypothetical protein
MIDMFNYFLPTYLWQSAGQNELIAPELFLHQFARLVPSGFLLDGLPLEGILRGQDLIRIRILLA